jgi:hypothetical protein
MSRGYITVLLEWRDGITPAEMQEVGKRLVQVIGKGLAAAAPELGIALAVIVDGPGLPTEEMIETVRQRWIAQQITEEIAEENARRMRKAGLN